MFAFAQGSVLMYLGYFVVYLAASGNAFGPDARFFPLWCLAFFLAGQGVSFFSLVALKVNIRSFSSAQRGQVVGLLQAAFGLSGGMLSIIRSAFFSTVRRFLPSFSSFKLFSILSLRMLRACCCFFHCAAVLEVCLWDCV